MGLLRRKTGENLLAFEAEKSDHEQKEVQGMGVANCNGHVIRKQES